MGIVAVVAHLKQHASIISGQFYGHMHRDNFRIVWSDASSIGDRTAVQAILAAPSISPNSGTNPSLRVVEGAASDGFIVNYEELYCDLINAALAVRPCASSQPIEYDCCKTLALTPMQKDVAYVLEYDFRESYKVPAGVRGDACFLSPLTMGCKMLNVSATAVQGLFHAMQQDPIAYTQWDARTTSQYSPERFENYCAVSYLQRSEFESCMALVRRLIGALASPALKEAC